MIKISLDPRTKLFMIFAVSFIVMVNAITPLEWGIRIMVTLIPILLLVTEGKYASAFRFTVFYGAALLLLKYCISESSTGIFSAILVGYCGIVAQFLPAMITAWYVIRTTKIGEFMSAMQKMHVPDGISISLAVVMRFFPTIKEEYSSIGKANVIKLYDMRTACKRVAVGMQWFVVHSFFNLINFVIKLRKFASKVQRFQQRHTYRQRQAEYQYQISQSNRTVYDHQCTHRQHN